MSHVMILITCDIVFLLEWKVHRRGISRDVPDNHRLSSKALVDFLTQFEQLNLEVNSFMLIQDGKNTAQLWRTPYRQDCPELLYSLSNSFTSIAIGIAWGHGFLDLHDKVITFFPNI